MDSWEWNKIFGAVLGTLILVLVIKFAAEALYETPAPAKPGYVVEGVEETATASTTAAPVEEPLPDFGTVLPTADVAARQRSLFALRAMPRPLQGRAQQDRPQSVGRGRARPATHPGFDYSSAMMASHDVWGFDKLFRYLKSPQGMVPGTKMSFAGLRSAQDRINLLAYLRTQADSPLPIPAPKRK